MFGYFCVSNCIKYEIHKKKCIKYEVSWADFWFVSFFFKVGPSWVRMSGLRRPQIRTDALLVIVRAQVPR
jgi:hypothetical protein